jgi:hypothetical protein
MTQKGPYDNISDKGKASSSPTNDHVDPSSSSSSGSCEFLNQLMEQIGSLLDSGHFTSIDEGIISERDLAYYGLKVPILISQAVIYLFFLIGFIYISYQQAISNVFLSPYVANASYCDIIPITNNGNFIIDAEGVWEGQPGFNPVRSQYEITFASLNIDENGWSDIIDSFRKHVEETYQKSLVMKDKAWNLIAFSSYNFHVVIGEGTVDIHFTGDASIMFDKYSYNTIGYVKYNSVLDDLMVCQPYNAKAYYSNANSNLNLEIPLIPANSNDNLILIPMPGNISAKFRNWEIPIIPSSPCPEILAVEPETLEFIPIDWQKSSIKYDMRSVATAIAVNLKILSLDSLTEFGEKNSFDILNGGKKSIRMMVDSSYPGMDPIICSFEKEMCGINNAMTLRVPIIVEGGSYNDAQDYQNPHSCPYPIFDCDELAVYTSDCSSMNFNIAFVENSDPITEPFSFYYSANQLFDAIKQAPKKDVFKLLGNSRGFFDILTSFEPPDNRTAPNIIAYNDALIDLVDYYIGMSFNASASNCGDISYRFNAQTLMKSMCHSINCTMTFLSMAPSTSTYLSDIVTEGYRINKYNTYVPFVNSSNSFISENSLRGMYKPPINLIQSYMTCTQSPLEAFISAIGIAFSNTTIITTILYVIILYITMKFINGFLHTDKRTQALSIYEKKKIYRTTMGILLKEIIDSSSQLKDDDKIKQLWTLLQAFDDHDEVNR